MKLILLEKTDIELRIEVQGETHTLLNLLQKTLLNNKNVEIAGYTIPHRLVDKAIFYVRTKGEEEPVHAVLKASEEIKAEAEDFKKALENSFRKKET